MVFSALVIVLTLAIAYIWGSRGFFSALIHLVCTIIAGAIAFAAWETVTALLMNAGSDSLVDWSWSLGLALPFAASLAVLRLATNAILPKNVDLDGVTNMVGGGVCGAISGVLTTGIFAISLGYMRLETSLMGYEPITFANNGSLIRTSGLLLPTDKLTARFYAVMSDSTFRTEENLAKWRPDVENEGPLLRINFDDGKSRHTHKPDSFEVLSHYRIEPSDANAAKNLFNDGYEPPEKKHTFTYLDDQQANPASSVIAGYVVKFRPGANEKSGQVVVGNAQLRLIVQKEDGRSMAVQPLAVSSRADKPADKEGRLTYARWRYEGQKPFIATVRGDNESPMAFEFAIPKNTTPLGLYVKGIRTDVSQLKPFTTFTSIEARDSAVTSGTLLRGTRAEAIETGSAVTRKGNQLAPNLVISDAVPGNLVFQKDDMQGLNVEEGNRITDGEAKFKRDRLKANVGDPKLQVRRLSVPEGQVCVQVVVDGRNSDWGFLSTPAAGMDMDKGPVLVDETGITYTPYGFVYETTTEVELTLQPASPVTRVSAMPILTRSRPDQKLTLLFRVGRDIKLKTFAVGGRALLVIDPPFSTGQAR